MHLLLAALLAISAGERARIDAIVERVMHERHVAGLSLGIARAGTTLYVRGYGLRDVARRLPADGFTIYRIGSVTKQFTAALVLQQVAADSVALDSPVKRYLPTIADGPGRATIAALLGQTSGIASLDGPLAFEPGTGWLYSNANYVLLGTVLQRVTGIAVPALLRQCITVPLGLASTGYDTTFARNVALGYAWHGAWDDAPPDGQVADRAFSAAAMVSNAPDLLRWLDDLRIGRVVVPATFASMATSGRLDDGVLTNYGFGFFVSNWFGYRVIQHPGYVDGFSSQDALVLDDGLEVAVLANGDAVDLTPLTESLVAILDAPRDPNLSAELGRPAQNEDARVTGDLRAIAQTTTFASLGSLQSVEFVERSTAGGVTYDKYRLTFALGQWWATIGYREGGVLVSLTMSPIQ